MHKLKTSLNVVCAYVLLYGISLISIGELALPASIEG